MASLKQFTRHPPHQRIRVAATTVRGRGKISDDTPCADWASALRLNKNSALLVVCDGLGKSRSAALGAALAGRITIEQLINGVVLPTSNQDWLQVFSQIRSQWLAEISLRGGNPKEHSTTLALGIVGPKQVSLCSIGDSFGVALRGRHKQSIELAFEQKRIPGQYPNVTDTLYNPNWMDRIQIIHLNPRKLTGVLLSTDGLADVSLKTVFPGKEQEVALGVVDVVLTNLGSPLLPDGTALGQEFAQNEIITPQDGDDIGVALATW